ncbi:MAG: DUF1629 domain-containing protein [Pseudomonadota bacterium]
MNTSDTIWCSDFMATTTYAKQIDYELTDNSNASRYEGSNAYKAGQQLDAAHVPLRIFWKHKRIMPSRPKLGDVFWITNAKVIVSEAFKTVLEGFNLGRTRFFEVPLFDDGEQVADRKFFVLNVAEVAEVGVPEETSGAILGASGRYMIPGIKGRKIAANPAAMGQLDLVHDINFGSLIFFSDRLAKAIKAAKIKPLTLVKCVNDEDTP